MVKMENADRSALKFIHRTMKWQKVIEQFEREGHDIVKISESDRDCRALWCGLNAAIKRAGKAETLACRIINKECYLLRKELLENGR